MTPGRTSPQSLLTKFTVKDATPAFCFIASTCKIMVQSKSTRTAPLPSEANVCSKFLSPLNPYQLVLNHCVRPDCGDFLIKSFFLISSLNIPIVYKIVLQNCFILLGFLGSKILYKML